MYESREHARVLILQARELHAQVRQKRNACRNQRKLKRLVRIDIALLDRMCRRLRAYDKQFPCNKPGGA